MQKNRYPDGYVPKIEYWQYKMNKAIQNLDQSAIEFCASKLQYFIGRQNALNSRLESLYS